MTEIREYDVVRVINLKIADRPYDGTASVMRPPRIGDVGTVLHEYRPEDSTGPVVVESSDENGRTIWLADFERDELELDESSAEFIAQYLERLRKARGPIDVCSPLENLDPQILQQYAISEQNEDVRAYLVEVIWQKRLPESAPFLARMLSDPSKKVWKVALDGLVTLGTDDALVALKAARASAPVDQLEYIDEAIDQLEHPEAWPGIK